MGVTLGKLATLANSRKRRLARFDQTLEARKKPSHLYSKCECCESTNESGPSQRYSHRALHARTVSGAGRGREMLKFSAHFKLMGQ